MCVNRQGKLCTCRVLDGRARMALLWATAASFSPSSAAFRCALAGRRKHADRLVSDLRGASADDPSAADRLIRKFLAASSKPAALHALSSFLSLSSPFAPPLYERISEASWFSWKPKLAATVVALLEKQGRCAEAETLTLDAVSRSKTHRDLALFYCDLIECFSEQGLEQPVLETYARLREVPFAGRRPYESMIKALCLMGMPGEAEAKLKEMASSGCKPSPFEFRSVIQSYGRSGLLSEIRRVVGSMEDAGLPIDTVCVNVVLSCYGHHGELPEMASWMTKMREKGIGFSIRTFNCVLNSCPRVVSIASDAGSLPLSMEELLQKLENESSSRTEALLVQELTSSSVLADISEWSPSGSKLDLHGLHVAAAYIILLKWMQELRRRFQEEDVIPLEISVICGSGKHSERRGRSPIKDLVSEMMFRKSSPMRIDSKNPGRFVARGKAVWEWMC
ncbi:pentatricopeptide repeat-containing protein At2g17033-like [Musa acuminata AAA Group]|uniref:pentatricopeptide repeat-containing protein At2g17033-like n=1 Tax=Musa acuminata AAA Group TaxID=214697 RepID=UPI0031DB079F